MLAVCRSLDRESSRRRRLFLPRFCCDNAGAYNFPFFFFFFLLAEDVHFR